MKILPVPMLAAGLALLPSSAQAEFFADGKAGLELRNFYFNRDDRQPGASQSYSEEWAQGFLLRYESGYTEGSSAWVSMRWACWVSGWTPRQSDPVAVCCRIRRATGAPPTTIPAWA